MVFSMDLTESTFLNTDPADSGDLSTGASSVMDSTPSSQPSSSTIAPPPVTEGVGSGPPVAAIGGAVGGVVVLSVIGVIFLIVVGAVCGVRKRRQNTVNKPAHGTFGECSSYHGNSRLTLLT